MSQAADVLKGEAEWFFGDETGMPIDALSMVVPDPPPVVHTYKNCVELPFDIIPCNEEPESRDAVISGILSLIEPHESQRNYRASVRAFITRVVRRLYGAKVFEVGLHSLQYFLPTDPIRLSILLRRSNPPSGSSDWISCLTEKLELLSTKDNPALIADLLSNIDDDGSEEVTQPLIEHDVSSISIQTVAGTQCSITCTMDTENSVEIMANCLNEIRLLAFFEEVAVLVGKNGLFHRSLLLIRAWWRYQAHSINGEPLLNDWILSVLVVSVFNQHHMVLFQPLQVLSVFVTEYCGLNWTEYAVTIQGIVPFRETKKDPLISSPLASPGNHTPTHPNPGSSLAILEGARESLLCESDRDTFRTKSASYDINASTISSHEPPTYHHLSSDQEVTIDDKDKGTIETEPWMRHATDANLISAAMLRKYAPKIPSPSRRYFDPNNSPSSAANTRSIVMPPQHSVLSTLGSATNSFVSASSELCDAATATTTTTTTKMYSPDLSSGEATDDAPTTSIHSNATTNGDKDSLPITNGHNQPIVPEKYKRFEINVVHPFSFMNMVMGPFSVENGAKLSELFQRSADDLHKALQMQGHSLIHRFFLNVTNTFHGGYRPDVFKGSQSMCLYSSNFNTRRGNATGSKPSDEGIEKGRKEDDPNSKEARLSNCVHFENIWEQACYMDLILTGNINEPALLILSKEILCDRGTLPVGEIGKVLQELTATTSLSGKLKEKFGGLKKFLEKFPCEFMICTDHPFNPHVFIKKSLSESDMAEVAKGIISILLSDAPRTFMTDPILPLFPDTCTGLVPVHLTAKYKKAMAIRNKRAKAAEDAAVAIEGIGQIVGNNLRSSSGSSVGGNSSIPSGMTSGAASISPSTGRGIVISPPATHRFVSSMTSNGQGGHNAPDTRGLPLRVVPTSPLSSHDGMYNANNRFNNSQSIPSSISPSAVRGIVGPPAILLQQQQQQQQQHQQRDMHQYQHHHQRELQYQNQHYFAQQQQQQQQQQVRYEYFALTIT